MAATQRICLVLSAVYLCAGLISAGGVAIVATDVADNGDGDGFADTNETIELRLQLQNTSGHSLSGIALQLSTDSPYVACVSTPGVSVGTLAAGATAWTGPLRFTVADVDRQLEGLSLLSDFSVRFDVTLLSNEGVPAVPDFVALDLDLDVSGGTGPTTYFEGFELGSGLGSFTTMNLDQGRNNNAASDGYRCQYNDPDWVGSNTYGMLTDCFLGADPTQADAFFWQINGPTSPDGGRSFSGKSPRNAKTMP